MNVTIDRAELARGLTVAARGTERGRTSLEILRAVKIETRDRMVCLSTTDLESGWRVYVPADVTAGGVAVVPLAALAGIVKGKAPKGALVGLAASADGKGLVVTAGAVASTIPAYPASDYPVLPGVPDWEGDDVPVLASIGADDLARLSGRTVFAAATDTSRPILEAVWLAAESHSDSLRAAATDGFRLTTAEAPLVVATSGGFAAAVPAPVLSRFVQSTAKGDMVRLIVAPERQLIALQSMRLDVVCRLVEGNTPDYEKIIPTAHALDISLDSATLRDVVASALPTAADCANVLRMTPDGEGAFGQFVLTTGGGESAKFRASIPAKADGEPIEFALNARYLADYLASPIGELTVIRADTPSSPVLLLQPDAPGYVHLIMPMHIAR